MRHTSKERFDTVELVRTEGLTLREAERRTGVPRTTVERWCREAGVEFRDVGSGGGAIVDKKKEQEKPAKGFGLGLAQRLAIETGLGAGATHAQIAAGIGYSRSTVTREISRHSGPEGYDPYAAQLEGRARARCVVGDGRRAEESVARVRGRDGGRSTGCLRVLRARKRRSHPYADDWAVPQAASAQSGARGIRPEGAPRAGRVRRAARPRRSPARRHRAAYEKRAGTVAGQPPCISMEPTTGFEPVTYALRERCSTS
jgi:uncharacterized protein YerC